MTHLQSGNQTIWSYRIELWGCASKSNIVIMQIPIQNSQSHNKCPAGYVTNHTLHTKFTIPYVTSSMKESINTTSNWKPIPIHYYNHYYKM